MSCGSQGGDSRCHPVGCVEFHPSLLLMTFPHTIEHDCSVALVPTQPFLGVQGTACLQPALLSRDPVFHASAALCSGCLTAPSPKCSIPGGLGALCSRVLPCEVSLELSLQAPVVPSAAAAGSGGCPHTRAWSFSVTGIVWGLIPSSGRL